MYNSFLVLLNIMKRTYQPSNLKKKERMVFEQDGYKSWKGGYFQKKKKGQKSTRKIGEPSNTFTIQNYLVVI